MTTDKLPNGWALVKFGDLVRNSNENSRDLEAEGVERVVGLDHLDPGSLRLVRWDELADLPDGTTFTRKFRPGHVLFGKRRAYQRKVAVPDFAGVCSGDILVFEPADDRMLAQFLPYLVQSDGFFSHALGTSAGSLSPRTKWAELAKYEFALPPIDEQQRIVSRLAVVDSLLDALNRAAEAADSVYESLQHEHRRGEVRRTSIAELVTTARAGGTPARAHAANFGGGIPWLKSGEVCEDGIRSTDESISETGMSSSSAWMVPAGTSVIAMYGATAGEVGFTAIPLTTNQAVLALVASESTCGDRYIYHLLRGASGDLKALAVGAAQPNLSKDRIMTFEVPDCSLDDQEAWLSKVEAVAAVSATLRRRSESAIELRLAIREAILGASDVQ